MKPTYPKECPVFRVKDTQCAPCPVGGIVVGVYVDTGKEFRYPIVGALYADSDWPSHCWWYKPRALRPLTPAARAMLAIARGSK